MKTVIWLAGGQRTGSNVLGLFLYSCGLKDYRIAKPKSSHWNEEYSDDPWILAYSDLIHFNGNEGNPGGCPHPEEPNPINYHELNEFNKYILNNLELCDENYLLKSNTACSFHKLLKFPKETKHILVLTTRNLISQSKSLSERTGCSFMQCEKYLKRCEKELIKMKKDFETVFEINFDEVQKSRNIWIELIENLKLKFNTKALSIFDFNKIRF